MRKAAIFTALLLALSVTGACFAAAAVYAPHDQVALTETVHYGESTAARGLTARIRCTYDRHLFWDTTLPLGGQARTEYSFSSVGQDRETRVMEARGVELGTAPLTWDEDVNAPQTGAGAAWMELYRSLSPGGEGQMEVFLRDYMEFYPVSVTVDVPGMQWRHLEGYETPEEGEVWDPGSDWYALAAIRDEFRIPVLEEERGWISMKLDGDGQIVSAGWASGSGGGSWGQETPQIQAPEETDDWFSLDTICAMTGDACYFTFDAHSVQGNVVDTSALPGGYGLFRLPYDQDRRDESGAKVCAVDAGALEMVYPLDPAADLLHLSVSEDESKLLLLAVEDGRYVLRVIDLASMDTVRVFDLASCSREVIDWNVYDGEGFHVFLLRDANALIVAAPAQDGGYALPLRCPLTPAGGDEPEAFHRWRSDPALAFDGERLAFGGNSGDCGFSLAVYDAGGLAYNGTWASSLDRADGFSVCRALYVDPLDVSWDG